MRLVLHCAAGETCLTSQEVGGGQVSDPLATQTVSHLSAPHRAVAPLGWQFDSVVLGCLSLPQPLPRWYDPGLSTPPCRAQGLPRRTHTGTVFQLSTRLLYLPSWGPCHLFLFSHPLRTRNEADWFLPRVPHLSLLHRQVSSFPLVLPLPWGSWPACKEGQEGLYGQKGPLMPYASRPAVHTWNAQPCLLCTLGVCIPSYCAHVECVSPASLHIWSVYPLLLCTLLVCTPEAVCIGVCIPSCCAHLEYASPASVPTWRVYPLLLRTRGVCIPSCCQNVIKVSKKSKNDS